MRKEVENLIKQEVEHLDVTKKQMRDKHLISLGLIDEEKTTRNYVAHNTFDGKYDEEKQSYYEERAGAFDVTDEEYAELCKYFPPSGKIETQNNSAEKMLKIIADVVLYIGIIASIILFLVAVIEEIYGLLLAILVVMPTSLVTWASLRVFVNISNSLKEINQKTKNE